MSGCFCVLGVLRLSHNVTSVTVDVPALLTLPIVVVVEAVVSVTPVSLSGGRSSRACRLAAVNGGPGCYVGCDDDLVCVAAC